MARGKDHTKQSFEKLVHDRDERFIERGRYGQQLNRYLEFFNREQLLVLIHEELLAQPVESSKRICSFLGIDDEFSGTSPGLQRLSTGLRQFAPLFFTG